MKRVLSRAAFLIFLFVTSKYTTAVKVLNGCPEHFARVGMHCTTIVFQQMPWDKAQAECRGRASTMFMIKDKATFEVLLSASPANATQKAEAQSGGAGMPSVPGNLMMGLKYTASDKKWHWDDGTLFDPTKDWAMWSSASPPTPNKDACVVWKKKGKDVKWDLADCPTPGFTICYTKATSPVQTCPDRYMQEADICIMVMMKLDASYNEGSQECSTNGGAVVAMLKEESQLKRIQSLGGGALSQLPVAVWMGLKFTASEGKWKWSDGQEYHIGSDWGLWKDGQAPGTPSADTCVTMTKSASPTGFDWNAEDCNAQKGIVVCSKQATADPSGASSGDVAPSGGGGGGGSGTGPMEFSTTIGVVAVLANWIMIIRFI